MCVLISVYTCALNKSFRIVLSRDFCLAPGMYVGTGW